MKITIFSYYAIVFNPIVFVFYVSEFYFDSTYESTYLFTYLLKAHDAIFIIFGLTFFQ